jgi:hypothetical protein
MPAPIEPSEERVLTLHLLDTAQGFPIQTWTFVSKQEVRIGRASDNEVVITHPYVSRYHARLVWHESGWELINLGSHGSIVHGQRVVSMQLAEADEILLGPRGPTLRYHWAECAESIYGTLAGDMPTMPSICIDRVKKEQEVRAVAQSDYFRQLQERLQTLRERRG